MFPDLEFIKTCLNGLRSQIERVEKQIKNWVTSFVRANRPNWAQNDPDALDYIKGRTHYEVNGRVVQLPSKFLPSPTSNAVGAIKADSAKTTDIQPVRLGTDGKLYSSGIPIFTTSGTGRAYTANVPEITELVDGMLVVMIPHVASGSITPKLNINGLGAYLINRFRSNFSGSYQTGVELSANTPVLLMYNSGRWFACNFTQPDVQDLFGTVPTSKGGTGASSLTKGSYLVGNDTRQVQLKTPSEVLADIGAIPVPATASVGQVIAVKAVDADGKPTEWEAADALSGGETWELIAFGEMQEPARLNITKDNNGLPFSLKSAQVFVRGAISIQQSSSMCVSAERFTSSRDYDSYSVEVILHKENPKVNLWYVLREKTMPMLFWEMSDDISWRSADCQVLMGVHRHHVDQENVYRKDPLNHLINKVSIGQYMGNGNMAAGCKYEIWGVRA